MYEERGMVFKTERQQYNMQSVTDRMERESVSMDNCLFFQSIQGEGTDGLSRDLQWWDWL